MKRHNYLYSEIIDFSNLLDAARKAEKGKRFRENVLHFNHKKEENLLALQQELISHSYRPGRYKTFYIQEPKTRLISAAPYRDRVVHHALCNIINPIFEKSFIPYSYANRCEFGTHKALNKFVQDFRNYQYILQCDIRKYFPTIDHQILKSILRKKIKCPPTLWLLDLIIDNSNTQEWLMEYFPEDDLLTPIQRRKGLPIGNLTSQLFANIYLNYFDHFILREVKPRAYLRYVDDFALFSESNFFLQEARERVEKYLMSLRLKIHPIKSQIFSTDYPANFLGFRVSQDRIRIRSNNLHLARLRCKRLQKAYAKGNIGFERVCQSLQSWQAHLDYADSYNLQRQIFSSLIFVRN